MFVGTNLNLGKKPDDFDFHMVHFSFLSLVHLRTHGFDPQRGCAVRTAVFRTNEAALQKALEDAKAAVGQDMTVARVTNDVVDFAVFQALMMDRPAKGELVQNTLFVL